MLAPHRRRKTKETATARPPDAYPMSTHISTE